MNPQRTLKLFFGIWLPACTENCIHTVVSELCECCINLIFLNPAFLSKAPNEKKPSVVFTAHCERATVHSTQ